MSRGWRLCLYGGLCGVPGAGILTPLPVVIGRDPRREGGSSRGRYRELNRNFSAQPVDFVRKLLQIPSMLVDIAIKLSRESQGFFQDFRIRSLEKCYSFAQQTPSLRNRG